MYVNQVRIGSRGVQCSEDKIIGKRERSDFVWNMMVCDSPVFQSMPHAVLSQPTAQSISKIVKPNSTGVEVEMTRSPDMPYLPISDFQVQT